MRFGESDADRRSRRETKDGLDCRAPLQKRSNRPRRFGAPEFWVLGIQDLHHGSKLPGTTGAVTRREDPENPAAAGGLNPALLVENGPISQGSLQEHSTPIN